ncbi:hypothetical protein [Streptomyces griseorubiginosus]|uniref:hypothetical protein n=1 Tax=Streptomyces griseorubiginosus TaxID=67304 RepID=UPI002E81025E|nr:hypothetical protein [Streptomyces griseorubiginosus]WUB41909.1 hypothetical protein OHN19_00660 [Streptomyces griseorubiginosus]WUB50429.1 hypothetical protein OG942_00655 [Streptomyces griseorubiginosus]
MSGSYSSHMPRAATGSLLYVEVEQVRGDSFRADWRISDLIRHAAACGAPDPGVVCSDDGPEFTALEEHVRAALEEEPGKEPDLAGRTRRSVEPGIAGERRPVEPGAADPLFIGDAREPERPEK